MASELCVLQAGGSMEILFSLQRPPSPAADLSLDALYREVGGEWRTRRRSLSKAFLLKGER